MNPTNKLRFVDRVITTRINPRVSKTETVKVLQQWWEDRSTDVHWLDGNPGEWRDVPTEEHP